MVPVWFPEIEQGRCNRCLPHLSHSLAHYDDAIRQNWYAIKAD